MFSVINLAGGRLDPPFYPTKGIPFIKGLNIVSNQVGQHTEIVSFPFDAELVAVSGACSLYQPDDYWNLSVGGELIFDEVYTKNFPEGVFLMAVIKLPADTEIRIDFNNATGNTKKFWVNLQLLK